MCPWIDDLVHTRSYGVNAGEYVANTLIFCSAGIGVYFSPFMKVNILLLV